MKIQSSQVAMEGSSHVIEYHKEQTSQRIWGQVDMPMDELSLSKEGLGKSRESTLSLNVSSEAESSKESLVSSGEKEIFRTNEPGTVDPDSILSDKDIQKLQLLEQILERLTGKPFRFRYLALLNMKNALEGGDKSNPLLQIKDKLQEAKTSEINRQMGPQPLGWGVHIHHETQDYKRETVDFSSKGTVQTEDGRAIDFNINYHFSQEAWSSTSIDFKAGDALIDPLVIRLDNSPLTFSDDPIEFDLNIDGVKDKFRVPVGSTGFLFYDRDGNHVATNGSELFGPTLGNGFEELKALDQDQNGWIDENDNAFKDLRIWVKSTDGSDKYLGLIESGVGALFVGGADTKTNLYTSEREVLGQMKQTGFYLKENGSAGLMHELDFKI